MKTILLVDDDEMIRDYLATLLVLENYSVLMAESGPEALKILDRGDHVDLVISDICMPEMTGFDLYDLSVGHKLPYIFITGCFPPELSPMQTNYSSVPFLFKPFHREDLMVVVEKQLTL